MAASVEVLMPQRLSSVSPNGSPMERVNILKGLKSCSKGRLNYDADWKPTNEALAACSKPPLLSSNLSTVSRSSTFICGKNSYISSSDVAEVQPKKERKLSDDFSFSSLASSTESDLEDQTSRTEKNAELLEKELQASFDDTHVAIHHYEIERRHEAGERLNSRKEKFVENSKKLVEEKNHYLQQKENERVDEFIRSVQALQQDEERKSEEARLRQQKLEQSHQEYKERAVRKVKEVEELRLQVLKQEQQIKKELQQLEVSCNSVKETAMKIQQAFQECKFKSLLSPSVSEILSEMNKVLKVLQNSLDSAHENGRASEMNVKIMQDCSALIHSLLQKAKSLVQEANSKAAKEEAERQAKEEAKVKEEEEKRQQAAKASKEKQNIQTSTSATGQTSDSSARPKSGISKELSSCISDIAWKEYSRLANYKSEIVKAAEPLNTDKSLKQYKFDLHKAVTTPINAISDQSPSHLLDKIQRLAKLLSGQSVQVGGKQISIAKHSAAKPFCKELLARKLVQQGSQQVSSSHSSAFPIAAVIIGMWSSFPDVGDLILAQFYDQCPFLVPFYIPRAAELSDAEYFASLGYLCSEGDIEERDKFLKRMTGIVRLYAAVLSSIPPSGQTKQHPYGLGNGWTWLSRMLNLEPRPDYTATALYEFLAVAGHALMRQYKKQFGKLLNTLVLDYVPKIEKVTDKAQSGPVVRLKVFLETCIKDQKISLPDGYLTPHWWRSSSF